MCMYIIMLVLYQYNANDRIVLLQCEILVSVLQLQRENRVNFLLDEHSIRHTDLYLPLIVADIQQSFPRD